jgi:hypothetical protein
MRSIKSTSIQNRLFANYKRPEKKKRLINDEEFNHRGAFPRVTAHTILWTIVKQILIVFAYSELNFVFLLEGGDDNIIVLLYKRKLL